MAESKRTEWGVQRADRSVFVCRDEAHATLRASVTVGGSVVCRTVTIIEEEWRSARDGGQW